MRLDGVDRYVEVIGQLGVGRPARQRGEDSSSRSVSGSTSWAPGAGRASSRARRRIRSRREECRSVFSETRRWMIGPARTKVSTREWRSPTTMAASRCARDSSTDPSASASHERRSRDSPSPAVRLLPAGRVDRRGVCGPRSCSPSARAVAAPRRPAPPSPGPPCRAFAVRVPGIHPSGAGGTGGRGADGRQSEVVVLPGRSWWRWRCSWPVPARRLPPGGAPSRSG